MFSFKTQLFFIKMLLWKPTGAAHSTKNRNKVPFGLILAMKEFTIPHLYIYIYVNQFKQTWIIHKLQLRDVYRNWLACVIATVYDYYKTAPVGKVRTHSSIRYSRNTIHANPPPLAGHNRKWAWSPTSCYHPRGTHKRIFSVLLFK
jgi:hypothetical protein